MATGAYLLIQAAEAVRHNGYLKALEDLWELPEVVDVEPVSGLYDCVVRVEAPIRLIYVVHKVMKQRWIEHVHVLRVDWPVTTALESEEARAARLLRQREIIWAARRGLPRPPVQAQQLYPGHAGPTGAEEAWMARLKRQREIIRAHYERRRSPAAPAPAH